MVVSGATRNLAEAAHVGCGEKGLECVIEKGELMGALEGHLGALRSEERTEIPRVLPALYFKMLDAIDFRFGGPLAFIMSFHMKCR